MSSSKRTAPPGPVGPASFPKLHPDALAPESRAVNQLGRTADAMERARQEGLADGYQEGYQAGFGQGSLDGRQDAFSRAEADLKRHTKAFAADLKLAAERLDEAMREWYARTEADLTILSTAIAAEIVATEITQNPETIRSMVRSALQEVATADRLKIRLNPFDIPSLEPMKNDLLTAVAGLKEIELTADRNLPGGCIIESSAGIIHADVRTQIGLILDALLEARAKEAA